MGQYSLWGQYILGLYRLVAGLWPELRRSRMADITSSAAASVASPQVDVEGLLVAFLRLL